MNYLATTKETPDLGDKLRSGACSCLFSRLNDFSVFVSYRDYAIIIYNDVYTALIAPVEKSGIHSKGFVPIWPSGFDQRVVAKRARLGYFLKHLFYLLPKAYRFCLIN